MRLRVSAQGIQANNTNPWQCLWQAASSHLAKTGTKKNAFSRAQDVVCSTKKALSVMKY